MNVSFFFVTVVSHVLLEIFAREIACGCQKCTHLRMLSVSPLCCFRLALISLTYMHLHAYLIKHNRV